MERKEEKRKKVWCDYPTTLELVVQQIGMMETEKHAIQKREQPLSGCYLQILTAGTRWSKVIDRVGTLPPWALCWSKCSSTPTKLRSMRCSSETKNFCPWPSDTWEMYSYYVKAASMLRSGQHVRHIKTCGLCFSLLLPALF